MATPMASPQPMIILSTFRPRDGFRFNTSPVDIEERGRGGRRRKERWRQRKGKEEGGGKRGERWRQEDHSQLHMHTRKPYV